uniref:Uncharacterized protein n=1 Tax=uncultured Bacteroidota bacterium TaxID=152509 RepID=H5SK47_9BACT|nr:hypothetical protein HGMM_F40B03C21 [uncultured Bacteroidetes bacterium]
MLGEGVYIWGMRKWLSYPLGICWRGAGVALLSLLSAQSWQDVAGGTNFPVEVLFPWQGSLYVGGRFTAVGGSSLQANGIARYSSAGWSALGNPQGVSGTGHVYALTVYQGKLIVGGDFSGAGGGVCPKPCRVRSCYQYLECGRGGRKWLGHSSRRL